MIHTRKQPVEVDVLKAVTCDVCQTYYDDPIEIQACIQIQKTCSYGSIFGDEASIECDLCQHCVKALLGGSLRIGVQPVRA